MSDYHQTPFQPISVGSTGRPICGHPIPERYGKPGWEPICDRCQSRLLVGVPHQLGAEGQAWTDRTLIVCEQCSMMIKAPDSNSLFAWVVLSRVDDDGFEVQTVGHIVDPNDPHCTEMEPVVTIQPMQDTTGYVDLCVEFHGPVSLKTFMGVFMNDNARNHLETVITKMIEVMKYHAEGGDEPCPN